jgi:GNAT superfamily N-acetyltransferase
MSTAPKVFPTGTESPLTVRKVSRANADDIVLIVEEYYHEIDVILRDSQETLLSTIDAPKNGFWLAYVGSTPAGCVMLRSLKEIPGAGEVKRLYVKPAFRRHGIAHALMQALERDARKAGTEWLYLDTKDDLNAAIRFYEQYGYNRCARYNTNPQATIFMRKQLVGEPLLIRTFQPGDETAFRTLNEAWITAYFQLEEKDRETLNHPVEHILEPGGQIFFAVRGDQTIACCALVPMEDGSFEVSKMTVAEQARGSGTGRKILQAVIDYAREHGIKKLYLETNSKLKDAIHLYEALGFRHIPEENRIPSPYARADVYMDLYL